MKGGNEMQTYEQFRKLCFFIKMAQPELDIRLKEIDRNYYVFTLNKKQEADILKTDLLKLDNYGLYWTAMSYLSI